MYLTCVPTPVINVDAQTVSSVWRGTLCGPLTRLSSLCWLLPFQVWQGIPGYSLFQVNTTLWIRLLFYFVLCLGKFASLGLTRSTCFAHGCGLSVRQQAFLRAALRRAASWSLPCSNQVTQSVSFLPCQVNHSPNNKGKSLLCLQSVSLILRMFMGSLWSLEKSAVFLCTIYKLGPYTNIVMHFSVLLFSSNLYTTKCIRFAQFREIW